MFDVDVHPVDPPSEQPEQPTDDVDRVYQAILESPTGLTFPQLHSQIPDIPLHTLPFLISQLLDQHKCAFTGYTHSRLIATSSPQSIRVWTPLLLSETRVDQGIWEQCMQCVVGWIVQAPGMEKRVLCERVKSVLCVGEVEEVVHALEVCGAITCEYYKPLPVLSLLDTQMPQLESGCVGDGLCFYFPTPQWMHALPCQI